MFRCLFLIMGCWVCSMCIAVLLCFSLWNLLVRMGFKYKFIAAYFYSTIWTQTYLLLHFLTSNANIHINVMLSCNRNIDTYNSRISQPNNGYTRRQTWNNEKNKKQNETKTKKRAHNDTQHGKNTAEYLLRCSSLRQLQWCYCCANAVSCMRDLQFNCSENENMLSFCWMYSC